MTTVHLIGLDAQCRLRLPATLIAEAGLGDGEDLVAYTEQGCIVISTRARLLSSVQEMFRTARGQDEGDPADELVEERSREAAAEATHLA